MPFTYTPAMLQQKLDRIKDTRNGLANAESILVLQHAIEATRELEAAKVQLANLHDCLDEAGVSRAEARGIYPEWA